MFHSTIETGLTPSTKVLEQKWASSWIYGLVPPKTVETVPADANSERVQEAFRAAADRAAEGQALVLVRVER